MCIPKMPVIMSLIDVNDYCMNDKIYRITLNSIMVGLYINVKTCVKLAVPSF